MKPKAVALLSGGLDSTLAICILKEQEIEIEAVNFQTMFGCCKDDARQVAHRLGVPFTTLKVADDYLKVIEAPKYGYGRGINPCVDCRIYMFAAAKRFMEKTQASFLISGEVLGQRPMSQKREDFKRIECDTGLEGLIVRPLSARLLPETEPERAGIIDRSRLYAIRGRSRHDLLELARKYGIDHPPSPSSGCALTSPLFAKKVKDIFDHRPDYRRWEFEVLKIGRHFRLDDEAKVIVSKNERQNEYLESLLSEGTVLLDCINFGGPKALLIGTKTGERVQKTASIMLRYAQKPLPADCEIRIREGQRQEFIVAAEPAEESLLERMRIV